MARWLVLGLLHHHGALCPNEFISGKGTLPNFRFSTVMARFSSMFLSALRARYEPWFALEYGHALRAWSSLEYGHALGTGDSLIDGHAIGHRCNSAVWHVRKRWFAEVPGHAEYIWSSHSIRRAAGSRDRFSHQGSLERTGLLRWSAHWIRLVFCCVLVRWKNVDYSSSTAK